MDEAFKELKGMYGSQIDKIIWRIITDIRNNIPMYKIERMINNWIRRKRKLANVRF